MNLNKIYDIPDFWLELTYFLVFSILAVVCFYLPEGSYFKTKNMFIIFFLLMLFMGVFLIKDAFEIKKEVKNEEYGANKMS